jgi:hypothetical protein
VLVEFRLTVVSSLGAGLSGGCIWDIGRLLWVLESVLVLENCVREVASLVFSSDACRTFTLTRPRFAIGSKVITRGFGIEMLLMSIESLNFMCRRQDVVGAMLLGRVSVAVIKYDTVPRSN